MKKIILTLGIAFVSYGIYATNTNKQIIQEEIGDCYRHVCVYSASGELLDCFTVPCSSISRPQQ